MSQVAADELVAQAHELFRAERFMEAATRYERASQIYPQHALAWKGLGHALLCLGKPHEAARAFDRAIGIRPDSATALWGGAVAHAEVGNKVVAQNYLRRTLALQPSWIEMAKTVAHLAPYLEVSTRVADALKDGLGAYSTRTYGHATDPNRSIEVARFIDQPGFGHWTFASLGLSNKQWPQHGRPRVELLLATTVDAEVCGQILANLAFHLGETGFFPEPGVMVRDVVGALGAGDLSQRLPHVYIGVPRAWPLDLPLVLGPPTITLAQVIPISEAEYTQWRADVTGFDKTFAQRKVDIADLRRPG